MIINGRDIAEHIFEGLEKEIAALGTPLSLTVFTCAPNFETQAFLRIKGARAKKLGVAVSIVELPEDSTTETCIERIKDGAKSSDGIIVQLPFPSHINRDELIAAIPVTHDVDAFVNHSEEILPPVVGAIKEIVKKHNVVLEGKRVVVIGKGELVGKPTAVWMKAQGAHVSTLAKDDGDISTYTKEADIIVLGAGAPGLLRHEMIKEGVVIFDAGTSEAEGELKGDADPACAKKASLFTPVPGGIGPITIAILFKNLLTLSKQKA